MKLSILDPQNDPRLFQYATTKAIADAKTTYNFYSIMNYGYMLNNLIPLPDVMKLLRESSYGDGESLEFDKAYANQLLNNTSSFIDLMTLMFDIQRDEETIVLSNYNHRVVMPILDSLLKFIQERYGIDSYLINYLEDIDQLTFSEFASVEQRGQYIMDCQKYLKMTNRLGSVVPEQDIRDDLQSLQDSVSQEPMINYYLMLTGGNYETI